MLEDRTELTALLREQNALLKKQLTAARVCAAVCVVLLLAAVIAAAVVLPRAMGFLQEVSDAVSGMKIAVDEIKNIDIETLNEAIADLKRIIEPLANLFGG